MFVTQMTKVVSQGLNIKVSETKVTDKTCDRTTAELMFYHRTARNPI